MTLRLPIVAFMTALAIACGCSTSPRPPEMTPEELVRSKSDVASQHIDLLITDNMRMRDIEYALTTSTAQKCGPLSRPRLGVLFFRADAFEDELRRTA